MLGGEGLETLLANERNSAIERENTGCLGDPTGDPPSPRRAWEGGSED